MEEKLSADGETIYNETFRGVYFFSCVAGVLILSMMSRACNTHGDDKKYNIIVNKPQECGQFKEQTSVSSRIWDRHFIWQISLATSCLHDIKVNLIELEGTISWLRTAIHNGMLWCR